MRRPQLVVLPATECVCEKPLRAIHSYSALAPLGDILARPLRDLRISVIDRCNFRCGYCMPQDSLNTSGDFLPRKRLLSDAEIDRLVRAFVDLGVAKIRITGGEPLLRPGLVGLIERLAGMTGGRGSVAQVLAGIDAAEKAGFRQLKINTVVQRGVNDHTVMDIVRHFRGSGHILRLIEFMDVGSSNQWSSDRVVPGSTWLKLIHDRWPLRPSANHYPGETARRYLFADSAGEIGLINSITEPFCGQCSRGRVSADGMFYTCLFSGKGANFRRLLSNVSDPEILKERIHSFWSKRQDRYSQVRGESDGTESKIEMYRLGG